MQSKANSNLARNRNSGESSANHRFAMGLLRALGGAILFSFPMLMTMEMWWLGFSMNPGRLASLILVAIPLLTGLSYYAGFEVTSQIMADVLDAFTAFAIGTVAAALLLLILGVIGPGMSLHEVVGKISLQAVPASIGAMLARRQFHEDPCQEEKRRSSRYGGSLFLMCVGALFLCSSLASTEEILLISFQMNVGQTVILVAVTMLITHGFVHAEAARENATGSAGPFWPLFLRFTVVGYALALAISFTMLWMFGRTAGLAAHHIIQATIVLAFPAALGAGASRLIL